MEELDFFYTKIGHRGLMKVDFPRSGCRMFHSSCVMNRRDVEEVLWLGWVVLQ